MGSILSNVKEVDNLHIQPFPAKPTKFDRVVRTGYGVYAVKDASPGAVWTTCRFAKKFAYTVGEWDGATKEFLTAMRKLGVITQKHLDEHMKTVHERECREEVAADKRALNRLCRKHQTTPPVTLSRKINKKGGD